MAVSIEQVKELGIRPCDEMSCIMVESGIIWLENNTEISCDYSDISLLPANIKLFLHKYCQIMRLRPGIASESISGLSQSFTGDIDELLYKAAESLLGEEAVKSSVRFVGAMDRWKCR